MRNIKYLKTEILDFSLYYFKGAIYIYIYIYIYGGIRLVLPTNLLLMQTNYGVDELVASLGKSLFTSIIWKEI